MLGWLNKNLVTVDVFTKSENLGLLQAVPPKLSAKFVPPWFKSLAKTKTITNSFGVNYESGSVRYCPGIKDYLSSGFIIPFWSDINIRINPDKSWGFQSADYVDIVEHNAWQYQGFMENAVHVKILTPWIFSSKQDVDMLLIDPFYHVDINKKYSIVPGFFNFKYFHIFNVNMFFKVESEPYQVNFKAHEPLVHIVCPNKKIKLNYSKTALEDLPSKEKFELSKYTQRPYFLNRFGKIKRYQVKDES